MREINTNNQTTTITVEVETETLATLKRDMLSRSNGSYNNLTDEQVILSCVYMTADGESFYDDSSEQQPSNQITGRR